MLAGAGCERTRRRQKLCREEPIHLIGSDLPPIGGTNSRRCLARCMPTPIGDFPMSRWYEFEQPTHGDLDGKQATTAAAAREALSQGALDLARTGERKSPQVEATQFSGATPSCFFADVRLAADGKLEARP